MTESILTKEDADCLITVADSGLITAITNVRICSTAGKYSNNAAKKGHYPLKEYHWTGRTAEI